MTAFKHALCYVIFCSEMPPLTLTLEQGIFKYNISVKSDCVSKGREDSVINFRMLQFKIQKFMQL
jgi:hypothetical protein